MGQTPFGNNLRGTESSRARAAAHRAVLAEADNDAPHRSFRLIPELEGLLRSTVSLNCSTLLHARGLRSMFEK
jgi:hypothetical protein